MSQPVSEQPSTEASSTPEVPEPTKPPWESSDKYDPDRAWTRITTQAKDIDKLRQELADTKSKLTTVEPLAKKAQELEDAQKTEQQRLTDQLAAAQRAASSAQAEAVRFRVAASHKIGQEDFDLLGTGTEEEITARAVRIAARNAEIAALQAAPKAPGSERPVESLRPGATPGDPQSEDDVLYAQLFPKG